VTYAHFLGLFLVLPIVVLTLALRQRLDRRYGLSMLGMAIVALVYTTPWDNAIIAMGVWRYDPTLVWGITLGWVPLEEYLFYILQTILTGLILLALLGSRVDAT
jgi:lycopene cyclase domain-containing protein